MMPPGGDGGTGGGTPSGRNAAYAVSVDGGTFGSLPVTMSADAITVATQTIRLDSASQVGTQAGHYRAFDSAGATSGAATQVHYFGQNDGYSYIQFGSWAKGVVGLDSGFSAGDQFGAFLAPSGGSALTPVSNMPSTGVLIYRGRYTGYTDTGSSVTTDEGRADISLNLDYIVSHPRIAVTLWGSRRRVAIVGVVTGNTFEVDVTKAHEFVSGVPRADAVQISDGISVKSANSGGMRGGFFGDDATEVGGIYQFTAGGEKSAGSFGGSLQ